MEMMPHCDSSVLHAPGECTYCDERPEWQTYRVNARINFTGHEDPELAPCPSTHFRSVENIERWHGNVPTNPATYRSRWAATRQKISDSGVFG